MSRSPHLPLTCLVTSAALLLTQPVLCCDRDPPLQYLQFEPEGVEDYIEFLLSIERFSEAALKLAEMLNRETVVSTRGMWTRLTRSALTRTEPYSVDGSVLLRGAVRQWLAQRLVVYLSSYMHAFESRRVRQIAPRALDGAV